MSGDDDPIWGVTYSVDVVIKKSGVGKDSIVRKGFNTCTRTKGRAWKVFCGGVSSFLVVDEKNAPGSLNAMCPSSPIPPKKSSIPPKDLITAS